MSCAVSVGSVRSVFPKIRPQCRGEPQNDEFKRPGVLGNTQRKFVSVQVLLG